MLREFHSNGMVSAVSQFASLKPEFRPIYDHARKAEVLALSDPRGACFYARLALETAVN